MKLPRNSKLLRSPFDAAPFAAVFFLLLIFLMLGELLPTPGLRLQLPIGGDLPGTDQATVAVAVDGDGRYYFDNQIMNREALGDRLRSASRDSKEPLTLLIHADKRVTYAALVEVTLLAREAGMTNALLATLPGEAGNAGAKP